MRLWGVVLAVLCVPGLSLGAPDASFTVYRGGSPGSKPAPLHVHFDANATTSSIGSDQPWRDLLFEWDYGDPSSGTWATNGLPKNRSYGIIGAHVYETAGTYTVTLTVTDRNGATDTAQQSVTVDNPDTVWGATTTCVSTSGTFTGCPGGATLVTSSDFTSTMQARVTAGSRRILFRRGETFVANSCWATPNQKTEGLVGAFGSGSSLWTLQIAAGNGDCAVRPAGSSINSATSGGWRFVEMKISSASTTSLAWGFKTSFIFDDLTIYKSDIGPTGFGFNIGPDQSGLNVAQNHYAVVDTQLRGNTGTPVSNPGSCWFGGAARTFISGVVCGQANAWQMRIAYVDKAVISNNIVSEVAGGFEAIKFHCSIGPLETVPGPVCSNMIFSDNLISKTRIDITGGGNDQGTIEKSVFERNLIAGTMQSGNPNNVARFNVTQGYALHNRIGVVESSQPKGNIAENNVFDMRGDPSACVNVGTGTKVDGLLLRNNICFSSGSTPTFLSNSGTGSVTQTTNQSLNSSPFTAASPNRSVRTDYRLPEGSSRINAGTSGIGAGLDLLSARSPQGLPDLGAVEFQTSAPPPPECSVNADCNDSDQCTTDTCSAGTCSNTIATGASCTDGNASTINDMCTAQGACVGTPVECTLDADCGSDGNQCHSSACVANACVHPNVANGTSCNDQNPNTTGDQCTAGTCAGTVPACSPSDCNDGNQCTDQACVLGVCVYTPRTNLACNDGNAATENDQCWAGPPPVCAGVTPPPPPPPPPTPSSNRPGKPTNVRVTTDD